MCEFSPNVPDLKGRERERHSRVSFVSTISRRMRENKNQNNSSEVFFAGTRSDEPLEF